MNDSTTHDEGLEHEMMEEDFMQTAVNLESRFYEKGYADGHAHGRLHGLFEGRALGAEKAWELWEELGFYEGFAAVCERSTGSGRKGAKTAQHVATLRDLISKFPTTNPTPAGSSPATTTGAGAGLGEGAGEGVEGVAGAGAPADDDGPDLAALMSQIRARYRLLCTSVGARPRLVAAGKDGRDVPSAGVVEGIEGPMKGVDTRQLRF